MRILHYTIGFLPERSGGLPRYVTDLMNEQVKQGHELYAFYPGRINFIKKKTYLKKVHRSEVPRVIVYELINSLPLPLFGGIKEPNAFMKKIDFRIYKNFLDEVNVDVIHIHTLMGLHQEFFKVANEKKIKIVFTSHDYFGLSPVPDFYIEHKSWDENNTDEFWNKCANQAMSRYKLRIFQLSFYPSIRKLLNRIKGSRENRKLMKAHDSRNDIDFSLLRNYYTEIFKSIDYFHFNSNIAKDVYCKNLKLVEEKVYKVISITNGSICKHRNRKKEKRLVNTIAYIGPYQQNKGFYNFIDFAEKNGHEKYKFVVFGGDSSYKLPRGIENKGRFGYSELESILDSIDLLLIPSLWKETFGFLVLEALSFGIPVMVSHNVGAKMLLEPTMIFENLNDLVIPSKIESVLIDVKTIDIHVREIIELYKVREKND